MQNPSVLRCNSFTSYLVGDITYGLMYPVYVYTIHNLGITSVYPWGNRNTEVVVRTGFEPVMWSCDKKLYHFSLSKQVHISTTSLYWEIEMVH
jgi:hypothetical protein